MNTRQTEKSGNWELQYFKKSNYLNIKNPILIEGMPGIGNVGKIVMDMLISECKAEPLISFFSYDMPSSVFVNEHNVVELPKIIVYHKRVNSQDFLFLTGDVQPTTEKSSFMFCNIVLDIFKRMKGKYMVTLGGIGLGTVPDEPKVYITGNDAKFVRAINVELKKEKLVVESHIYGLVGPILGISGLLLGMSKKQDVKAYSLLGETFGHPMYIGLKGSRAILQILSKHYRIKMDFNKLDNEINEVDASVQDSGKESRMHKYKKYTDVNYIG